MADCKKDTEEVGRPPLVLKIDPPEEPADESTEEPAEESTEEPAEESTEEPAEESAEEPAEESTEEIVPSDRSTASPNRDEVTSRAVVSSDSESAPTVHLRSSSKKHSHLLAASKFGNSFGFGDFSASSLARFSKSSILRPPQLSALANSSTAASPDKAVLQPAKLRNPFTKITDETAEEKEVSGVARNDASANDDSTSREKPGQDAKPTFLPLAVNAKENENGVNNAIASGASTPSFVFGQNLKERVTVSNDVETLDDPDKEEEKKSEETNENGSSELLFSNAAANCRATVRPGLTLTQAAQVLEEANRASKRKYNQITPLTGEEGETNVLQINCKLFAFDKASSGWQERGRGTLRLNDRDEESRLVGRSAGTQRLILNTNVWPGMSAERAGPKSLRFTAVDAHGDVRIFIVQAAPKEVDQLHDLLLPRLKRARERHPKRLATEH